MTEEFEDEDYIPQEDVQEEYQLEGQDQEIVDDMANEMDYDIQDDEQGPSIHFEDDSIQGFFDHREPVFCVAIHPLDSTICCTGGGDDKSYLWKLDTGEKLADLASHQDSVSAVQFNHDGSFIASGGMDGKIFVFGGNGTLACTLDGPSEVTWLHWHPKGNVLLAAGEDGTVWMYQIPSGKCMTVFTGHADAVNCGRFTPDGKMVVTGSTDGTVIVWDPKTGAPIHKWIHNDGRFHQGPITALAVNPDSTLIVSGAQDGSVLLLQIASSKILGPLESHQDSVEAISFSEKMPFLATGGVDGVIHVIDTTTMKLRFSVNHDEAVTKLKWSPINPHLISSSVDGSLKVWDVRTGELVRTLKGHQNAILDFDIRPDGAVAVTGSDDGVSLVFPLV